MQVNTFYESPVPAHSHICTSDMLYDFEWYLQGDCADKFWIRFQKSPILLCFIFRWPPRFFPVALLEFLVLSGVICVFATRRNSSVKFFLTLPRENEIVKETFLGLEARYGEKAFWSACWRSIFTLAKFPIRVSKCDNTFSALLELSRGFGLAAFF